MALILGRVGLQSGEGCRLDGEAQLGGKAHRAQQAQVVLGEAFGRRADGADDPGAQVRLAAHPIVQLPPHRVVEQTVDGEVAAAGVGHRVAKGDPPRAPAVLVVGLGAEGGHLELAAVLHHHHDAEFAPDGYRALEHLLDLFRPGGGDDVVVAGLAPKENVADAAADPEGGEPRALEPADEFEGDLRRRFGRL